MSPNTRPAISATCQEPTEIPGIIRSARTTVADNTSHLIISLSRNISVWFALSFREGGRRPGVLIN